MINATVNIGRTVAENLASFGERIKKADVRIRAIAEEIEKTSVTLRSILDLIADLDEQGVVLLPSAKIKELQDQVQSCRETFEGADEQLNAFKGELPPSSTSRGPGREPEQYELPRERFAALSGVIEAVELKLEHGKMNLQLQLTAFIAVVHRRYAKYLTSSAGKNS